MKKVLLGIALMSVSAAFGVIPEADQAALLAKDGQFLKFDGKSEVQPFRAFYLTCPVPGKPFSGYFIPKEQVDLRLLWSDGFTTQFKINSRHQKIKRPANAKLKLPERTISASQAYLEFEGLPLKQAFVKPNSEALDDDVLAKLDPNAFPSANESILHLRAEAVTEGVAFYVNGSYAGTLRRPARPVQLLCFARGNEEFLDMSRDEKANDDYRELNLDLRSRGELNANLKLDAELPVPMRTNVVRGLDLRKAAPAGIQTSSVQNRDLSRTAFDALPMSYLFSTPAEQYSRAWVLCSVIPEKDHKPVFKLVMTRYAKYGRDELSMAVNEVDLSSKAENIRKVGSAEIELDGKKTPSDLYLVELKLDCGLIQDLIYTDPHGMLPFTDYLDIDLQGPGPRSKSFPSERSSVAVYAVTLERVPVAMRVLQSEPGNVFDNKAKPSMPVEFVARKAGKYTLAWVVSDVEGRAVGKDQLTVELAEGQTKKAEILVETGGVGWFGVDLTLADSSKNAFANYKASVAVLQPDTRKAAYDSPYTTWWFGDGSHQTMADPEIVGSYLSKAGIRATNNKNHSEKSLEKWKLTLSQIPNFGNRIYTDENILSEDPELWRKMEASFKFELDKLMKRYPHCRFGLILHESYREDYECIPGSILGRKFKTYDAQRERVEKARIKAVEAMCGIYRKYYPEVKVIFGNSCWSPGIVESFAAYGFNRALIDFLGTEAPGGFVYPPESFYDWNCSGSSYLMREISRLTSWNVPITACYEWTYRTSRELGMLKQAQWYMRDAMVAYAYGYKQIPIGGACDYATPYNNGGAYGQVGLCTREFQPKPAYVAAAVLTRILDQAVFEKQVATDDATLFAFAFSRLAGDKAYTAWVPSGLAQCEFEFEGDAGSVESEDIFGRRTTYPVAGGKIVAEVTPSIRYFVSKNNLKSVRTIARKYEPEGSEPPALVSVGLRKTDLIAEDKPHPLLEDYRKDFMLYVPEQVVPAVVADVTDADKGDCLSVRFDLAGLPQDSWSHSGYVTLKLAKPIDIPEDANGIGIWTKGNSSLGLLLWEVVDSKGNVFISNGFPGDGATLLNVAYENGFASSGWRFLRMPLTRKDAMPQKWFALQWYNKAKGALKPPLKLTGIVVSSSQKMTHINELAPVREQEIRLGKLAVYK